MKTKDVFSQEYKTYDAIQYERLIDTDYRRNWIAIYEVAVRHLLSETDDPKTIVKQATIIADGVKRNG